MTSAPTSKRTATERLTEEEQIRIRYAMLSVYYRSLGSQLETRGAPVVAVPPEVRPLSLADALEDLKAYPDRLWDAYWRIVRAVPVDGWVERRLALRYPTAFVEQLTPEKVEELDDVRRSSRAGAHLFAAALIACAESRWSEAIELAELIERHARDSAETQLFSGSTEAALGVPIGDFVRTLATDDPIRTARHLQQLQAEVGLNLYDFVQDFADTLAFQRFKEGEDAPTTALTSSCVVRQDTATLTTTATVTALISEPFEVLAKSIDPLGWPDYSDVIVHTAYLDDPFNLGSEEERRDLGQSFEETRYLFEDVRVHWGLDDIQTGRFRNVLAIDGFSVEKDRRTISLPFRLYRSVDSRILWDERPGGILIDEGYLRARPVTDGCSRVTTRKTLKFSDRTPYANAPGWFDFGQLLNYFAPASMVWWLETEFYTTERYAEESAAGDNPDPRTRGSG